MSKSEYIQSDTSKYVAGVDEVARGTFVGPVIAACVVLPHTFPDDTYKEIKDSKERELAKNATEKLKLQKGTAEVTTLDIENYIKEHESDNNVEVPQEIIDAVTQILKENKKDGSEVKMEEVGAWLEKYGSEDLPIQQVTRYKAMENILKESLSREPTVDEVANKLTSYGFHVVKEIN